MPNKKRNKQAIKLLALHRLFSAMFSFLLRARRMPPPSSSHSCRSATTPRPVQRDGCPPPPPSEDQKTTAKAATLVVDVDTALLLRSSSDDDLPYFPYFMLVALEAGGFLRGLLLLLLYPLLRILLLLLACCSGHGHSVTTRAMAAVAFCGLRAGRFRAGRAVLPKWFMEDVATEAFDAAIGTSRRVVCVTGMPRVMVEGFLMEYLCADAVVGREMKTLWGFYTGIMEDDERVVVGAQTGGDHELRALVTAADEDGEAASVIVGFSGSPEFLDHPLSRFCKEVYMVTPEEKRRWRALPRDKYPKPMVFHDGRLAFLPTAANTAVMFTWLPFGITLGAARLVVALTVPYRYSTPILAATGMSWRLKGARPPMTPDGGGGGRGQLFVCNHRTLIDPVYVSVALDRPVRAVSYSLSRVSELISPIGRTVRLTRDRHNDGRVMARLLARGDLVVVCPEGTTCREPYLLRFSPLFAELSDDGVVPVGIAVDTSAFYATTAGGLKCFDPLYYMINPRMCYTVQFLKRVDTSSVRDGAARSTDVANLVQRRMGHALGYSCTMLTRKDKYLMLAGNDGVVVDVNNDKYVPSSSPPPPTAAAAQEKKKND